MQLVHAALRADSHDDISVVVVTFTGTDDKSPPGSRHLQRKGSTSSLSGSSSRSASVNTASSGAGAGAGAGI